MNGFGLSKTVTANVTPSTIVYFDKATPTTVGVVFDPNTPATTDVLYVSSVDASTWIWDGSAYVTYTAPTTASTEWYLTGTTIDAGSNKTASITRSGDVILNHATNSQNFRAITGTRGIYIRSYLTGNNFLYSYNAPLVVGTSSADAVSIASNNTQRILISSAGQIDVSQGGQYSRFYGGVGTQARMILDSDNNIGAIFSFRTGNLPRWAFRKDGDETGTNVGGDLAVRRYDDAGAYIDSPISVKRSTGAITFNGTYTFPTVDGTANYFLKTNGAGVVSWAVAGLSFFAEAQATASPNNTVYANSLTASSSTANADFVIVAKGSGAILARIPDGTGTGGNKRGQYALDLSRYAGASGTYIAGGDYDIILGGSRNSSNTGTYSFIANGDYNSCTGTYGTILNGNNNTVSGARGIVLNGQYNQATGSHAIAGGLYSYSQSTASVALGSSTASGAYSMSINSATTASGANSFSANNGSTANGISSNAFGDNGWTNGIRAKFSIGASGWGLGNTQAGITQLDGRTTNATPTVLQANTQNSPGIDATVQFTLPNNSLIRVKGSIQGKQSGSTNCGVWDFDAVLVRGTTAGSFIVKSSNVNLVTNDNAWGTPTITANTTLGCMTVTVTGLLATNIQWACRIDSTETLYA